MRNHRYLYIAVPVMAAVAASGCDAPKKDLRTKYEAKPSDQPVVLETPTEDTTPPAREATDQAPIPVSNNESSPVPPDSTNANAEKILGTWLGSCSNDTDNDSSQSGTASFADDTKFNVTVQVFNGLDCADAEHESTYTIDGNYTDIAEHATIVDTAVINYKVNTINLAIHGTTVDTANRKRFCTLQNWVDGEPKEVTGLKCRRLDLDNPEHDQIIYDIFRVDGDDLQIGLNRYSKEEDNNGSSQEKRPTSLSDLRFKRKN